MYIYLTEEENTLVNEWDFAYFLISEIKMCSSIKVDQQLGAGLFFIWFSRKPGQHDVF